MCAACCSGGYGLDNATGRQHLPMEGRYSGAAPPVDAGACPPSSLHHVEHIACD